ncbi:MAG: hypothetical protein ACXW4P_27635 [Thermoanaerobaculia bacterium]
MLSLALFILSPFSFLLHPSSFRPSGLHPSSFILPWRQRPSADAQVMQDDVPRFAQGPAARHELAPLA